MSLKVPAVALATGLMVSLTACGGSSSPSSPASSTTPSGAASATSSAPATTTKVVIGSANFTENEVLADIYADALTAKGFSVTTKLNIGNREIYYNELKSGALNVFPEYNGALLDYLDPSATASSTAAVNAALAKILPSNLEALTSSPAQDKDSVSVTKAFATAHHLTSIADLKAIESQVVMGAAPEFATREEGLLGLKKLYGITFKSFKPLDESGPLVITALRDGTIQAADIYTTDPSIAQYHFVALADPKNLFASQNITPIVAKSVASPTLVATLDKVDAALTSTILSELVGAVELQHVDAATVAKDFVSQEALG